MKIINYEESFGAINFPENFEENLKGLSIEEQMDFYRTTEHRSYSITNWSERHIRYGYTKLDKTPDVKALIVKDDILVGAMITNHSGREIPCLAEECVCTYFASDNNGAGYKIRTDYLYLVCVPADFEKE